MWPFKNYVTCIMAFFTLFNFVTLCQFYSTTFPVSFSKLHPETTEWEGKRFFAHMAALTYHVISTEVENHIFKHNWIFRHFCIYKQPTLTKQWNFNIFVQILYSYFRYTVRLILGYALFVACFNTIRTSWETRKERLSYRKKCIEESVWGISLFWLHALLSMPFCCFLRLYALSLPKWHACGMAAINIHILLWVYSVWWYHKQTVKNMKIYNLILYAFFCKQRFFSTHPQRCLTFSWIEL